MDFKQAGDFVFTICHVGAEQALKKEIQREHTFLRFAYSRPGFLTFKNLGPEPLPLDFKVNSVFARAYGMTVGRLMADPDTERGRFDALLRFLKSSDFPGETMRLHVFERDVYVPGEEPPGYVYGNYAQQVERRFREIAEYTDMGMFYRENQAVDGDLVFNIVLIGEQEWWVGLHRHHNGHSPEPGGVSTIEFHPDAPSRAYLKLEEAIQWGRIPLHRGDQAVEIGSAPGGASFALLQRGVNVLGIDPGEMDPRVLAYFDRNPKFVHLKRSVSLVTKDDLPAKTDWLLLDMNVAPGVSLFAVERLTMLMQQSLLGLILTVKLNDWSMAEQVPSMIQYVRAMGLVDIRARQLFHNRQEFLIYGLTAQGVMREGHPPV